MTQYSLRPSLITHLSTFRTVS